MGPPSHGLHGLGLLLLILLAVPGQSSEDYLSRRADADPHCARGLRRLRGGARMVSELLGLRERDHPNATVAVANKMLWESAERGQMEGLAKSVGRGAELGSRGPGGWTALHYAARYGHGEAVSRLVEAGADIFSQTTDDYTAMDWAARNGHIECLTALHEHSKKHTGGPNQPPLGAIATLDRGGEIVQVVRTRPDTTGREMDTPWARFGKFEWQAKGVAAPPTS